MPQLPTGPTKISVPKPPMLTFGQVTLRLPTLGDVAAIVQFYNDNCEHLGRYSAPVSQKQRSPEFWVGRIPEMEANFNEDKACNLFLFDKAGAVLGFINFSNAIRGAFHCCTVGYGLAEQKQGQGLMTESLRVAINYVFGPLNFHRIEANYQNDNSKSAAVLKNLGFVEEGVAEKYLYIGGEWKSHVRTSLTNPNWQPS